MQITGMLWGRKLLDLVEYPHSEVRGPELGVDDIKDMIKRHKEIFIKPVFKGGVGKKGKSGLIGRAKNLPDALSEKERLYFAEHKIGNISAKSDGVTYEAAVPADHEVYFSFQMGGDPRTIRETLIGAMFEGDNEADANMSADPEYQKLLEQLKDVAIEGTIQDEIRPIFSE